jgi:hypothetical protein
MPKIIPIFYLPKEYPEDMRILVEALVANNGQTLKAALSWLEGKLVTHKAHKGKPAGTLMSATTIKNYLAGFYALDLFKANNNFYRDLTPTRTVSLSVHSKIEVIQPLKWILEASSIESFKERLTQVCSQYSHIVKTYCYDRQLLKDKYGIADKREPAFFSLIRKFLIDHCDYSYIGKPKQNNPVGYLEIFYQDKLEITNYLVLMNFIIKNYQDYATKNMNLVPISYVINRLKEVSDYKDDEIKSFLIKLRITNRIELRMTKSQLAENLGIELIDIKGVKYGFMKILDYTMVG